MVDGYRLLEVQVISDQSVHPPANTCQNIRPCACSLEIALSLGSHNSFNDPS
jgi:hypothetical protein